jgi:hypothetical protein
MSEHQTGTSADHVQPQPERRASDQPDGRRESVVDRRSGLDRRAATDRREQGERRGKDTTGLRRLRGPGRRRPEFNRTAEEGEFSDEQFLFVMAIDAFKRANQKTFPTWTEVLEVIRRLGYRKTQPSVLNLPNAQDWQEPADAPVMAASKSETASDESDSPEDGEQVDDSDFDALFGG